MKKILLILFIFAFVTICSCFAQDNTDLRDYDGIQLRAGTFIPVISAQEISTAYFDVGTNVKFISTSDLYLCETNIIPQNTEFFGYIEKINEPVIGTNSSMVIKIAKLRLSDGFELPVRGYIYMNSSTIIGGELTMPATYDRKASVRQGFRPMLGSVPGPTRTMGAHTVISSGADLMILLVSPLFVTHTVTN